MGGKFCDLMEHDRSACLKFAEKYGLLSPESYPFTDAKQALKFVQKDEEKAFVFKPDEGENFETWVPESEDPEDANKELQKHLETLDKGSNFILQQRKDGVETNIEVWFVNGEPKFSFMCLESKRKLVSDLGEFTGCAFDFAWEVPLDCEATKQSIGKLYPAYKAMNFTGMADANFIAAKDGIWFFEKCERFGYNSHTNLLFNLNRDELGKTLADMLDGTFKPNFTPGFGSSVSMYTDHPKSGKAIQFPEKVYSHIYFWDAYKDKDNLVTAGYDSSVLIALGFGYTIPTAWESCMSVAEKIKFPGRAYRNDGDKTCYPSSPLRRYEALKAMNLI
jgi:phosphoribosylamine-glycine ligase